MERKWFGVGIIGLQPGRGWASLMFQPFGRCLTTIGSSVSLTATAKAPRGPMPWISNAPSAT